jgi:hypothetical protein
MNSELASLVVIILIAIGAFIAYRANASAQKRKHEALTSPKKMEDWMANQGFVPDHFSFFHGTAIALKDGDPRIALYSDSKANFYPLTEIVSINAFESFDRGVPRGAAPGVVELNTARRFNIDLTVKIAAKPCKILFASKDIAYQWEVRLNSLISTSN